MSADHLRRKLAEMDEWAAAEMAGVRMMERFEAAAGRKIGPDEKVLDVLAEIQIKSSNK